jgi:hypothetical protein
VGIAMALNRPRVLPGGDQATTGVLETKNVGRSHKVESLEQVLDDRAPGALPVIMAA